MDIINGQNPNKVTYFDLRDYISKIKLDSSVLEHMEETNREFDKYMKKINICDAEEVTHLWLMSTAEELVASNRIENHAIKKQDILKEDLFFNTLEINTDRINSLHKFVMQNNVKNDGYRTVPIRVSTILPNGEERIFWHGPEAEDVDKFMNVFQKVYKSQEMSLIDSNPFLKSALIQLLFIRIHPYTDGNGRTARMLHSIKFTESVNKTYNKDYRLCPLNISESILINQYTYATILNNLYFDLEHDNTEYLNKWFNFILNMIDEQLYYSSNKLESLKKAFNLYKMDGKAFNDFLKRILTDMAAVPDINQLESEDVFQLVK